MIDNFRVLAIIPARSGSKGLRFKNTRDFCGKPLLAWSIECAKKSKYIDEIIVSTDKNSIAKIARDFGAKTPFLRQRRLSGDRVSSVTVIIDAIRKLKVLGFKEFHLIVLLEPTSPIRFEKDVDLAIKKLVSNLEFSKSLVSIAKAISIHPSYLFKMNSKGFINPIYEQGNVNKYLPRQALKDVYYPEGSIYISEISALLQEKSFYHENTMGFLVDKWKAIEIDDKFDFYIASLIKKKLSKNVRFFE